MQIAISSSMHIPELKQQLISYLSVLMSYCYRHNFQCQPILRSTLAEMRTEKIQYHTCKFPCREPSIEHQNCIALQCRYICSLIDRLYLPKGSSKMQVRKLTVRRVNRCVVPWCRTLRRQWGALLQDWALLGSCSPEAAAAYTPAFLPEPAAAVLPRMADAIDKAAPASLLALSSLLAAASNASDLVNSTTLLSMVKFISSGQSVSPFPPSFNGRHYDNGFYLPLFFFACALRDVFVVLVSPRSAAIFLLM